MHPQIKKIVDSCSFIWKDRKPRSVEKYSLFFGISCGMTAIAVLHLLCNPSFSAFGEVILGALVTRIAWLSLLVRSQEP